MIDPLSITVILLVVFVLGIVIGGCVVKCDEQSKGCDLDREIARSVYGDEWKSAIDECVKSHLPGDCPLCGADNEQGGVV